MSEQAERTVNAAACQTSDFRLHPKNMAKSIKARPKKRGRPATGKDPLYGVRIPDELMADIKEGIYVTELIGMGGNGVTGDYSRGAAGFMIRDGVLAEPVAEITIAGNLLDMFARLVPANDLSFRRGTDAPTIRIDGMVLAGA